MNGFEWSVNNSLEREYPVMFSTLHDRVEDKKTGLRTSEKNTRDHQNLEFLDTEITRMMVEKHKVQLSQSLDQSTPIFLIDGNNKQESHIVYDLLKQILNRYYDIIQDNNELVDHIRYIDPEFDSRKSLYDTRVNVSQLLIREQEQLKDRDSTFWAKRSEMGIGSNSLDLAAYSKQNLIFELLSKCIEETQNSGSGGNSYCYCINPQGLTPHEQKTLARILERGYLPSYNNSYCFLKVQNIGGGWTTYRNFGGRSMIQMPHDYSDHSFSEKTIAEIKNKLNQQ